MARGIDERVEGKLNATQHTHSECMQICMYVELRASNIQATTAHTDILFTKVQVLPMKQQLNILDFELSCSR